MIVCRSCAKLGSGSWKLPSPQRVQRLVKPSPPKIAVKRRASEPTQELELVSDFSMRVRQGREKSGLSHEDLGRKIREKVSVLRKIESGKMTPDHKLASRLEHSLKVKLLVPLSEPKGPSTSAPRPRGATLGEVARLKKRKAEVT